MAGLCDYPFPPAVADCYPPSHPKDPNPLPDHVSHFVFPSTLSPSPREHPPSFFTFVLTSSTGARVYASAMHVWEDVLAGPLLAYVRSTHPPPHPPWLAEARDDDILFLPRALVVLSHYPFYNCHRRFLQQVYRISLSAAPLPLERYIANFVKELPLPPKGRVDVK